MKVIGIGRLVRDSEKRATTSGLEVANFTVAWNKGESAYFMRCVALGNTARAINKYTKKGDRLFIIGNLQIRNWEKDNGEKIKITEILVHEFEFIEPKEQDEPQVESNETATETVTETDDDLPF